MRLPQAMFLGCVLLCLGLPMSRSALARETWSEVKHIQILEGPDRIGVFVGVVRITDYTDEFFLHLMSKHPDEEIVSQSVFTIDRLGNVTEKAIAGNAGPTFNPHLSHIFRLSDGFYLYQFPSLGHPSLLYRWRGDRFSPLDERESNEIKKKLLRAEQADLLVEVLDELDAISERERWRCVADDAFMLNKDAHPFVSAKHQIKISVRMGDQEPGWRSLRLSSVVASSISKAKPWSRTLIEVNTKSKRVRRKSIWRR